MHTDIKKIPVRNGWNFFGSLLYKSNNKDMKVNNHKEFACFDYKSETSTKHFLGDIVKKESEDGIEIGVKLIQIHDENEYRTDMFGNCHCDEIILATENDITEHRPTILIHI